MGLGTAEAVSVAISGSISLKKARNLDNLGVVFQETRSAKASDLVNVRNAVMTSPEFDQTAL